MEVITYGKEDIVREFPDCTTLQGLVSSIESQIQKSGRVVCRLKVNGMSFSENDENRLGLSQLDDVKTIEVEVSAPNPLVKSATDEVLNHMLKMQAACVETADIFRLGNLPQAHKSFADIIKANKELAESLIVLKPYLLELAPDTKDAWDTAEVHSVHTVRELFNAFERQDNVLLADILEYELYTNFGKWVEILTLHRI